MLDALNRTVLAEMGTTLHLQDTSLFFVMHESAEFLNISNRQLSFDTSKVKVPDNPLVFVKLEGVEYGSDRSGYKRMGTPFTFATDSGQYISVNTIAVNAKYNIAVYVPFGKQAMDIIGVVMLYMNRQSSLQAVFGSYTLAIPISFLIESTEVPTVETVLRDKGIKLYKNVFNLEARTWMIQPSISNMGSGDYSFSGSSNPVQYVPLKSINMQIKIGCDVTDQNCQSVEGLPCLLNP